LRKRYQEFYPKNPKNAILRSSNVDRVIDTMALVSGQLWPPNNKSDWIQPRIFQMPMPFDGVLNHNTYKILIIKVLFFFNTKFNFQPLFYSPYCPNGDKDADRIWNTSEVVTFNAHNQRLYDYVSNKTGNSADLYGTWDAFDVILSAKANGFKIPDWVT
jgi:hypothetical protein